MVWSDGSFCLLLIRTFYLLRLVGRARLFRVFLWFRLSFFFFLRLLVIVFLVGLFFFAVYRRLLLCLPVRVFSLNRIFKYTEPLVDGDPSVSLMFLTKLAYFRIGPEGLVLFDLKVVPVLSPQSKALVDAMIDLDELVLCDVGGT